MTREYATPLDAAMDRRRLELGMKWREVASAAGISYEALRAARAGDSIPAPLTRSGLERALKWRAGSIEALLSEGEPTPIDTAGEAPAEMDPREARIRAMPYLSDAEKEFYIEQLHIAEENARRRNAAKEADVRRGA